MTKLTIIVPVYNMSQYLRECVDSILNQTMKEFELLLIDDGSTDDSGRICDEYAAKDSRIRVIHKENSGLLATRIFSLHEASAPYVAFVDADDLIHPRMYQIMMGERDKYDADYVACGFYYYDNSYFVREQEETTLPGFYTGDKLENQKKRILQARVPDGVTFGFAWNKIYRKDALMKILDPADPTITMHEDETFTLPYLLQASRMVVLEDRLYFYRRREGSMSVTVSNARIRNAEKLVHIFASMEGLDRDFLANETRNRMSMDFMELVTDEQYRGIYKLYRHLRDKIEILKTDPFWSREFENSNPDAFGNERDRRCYIECISGKGPVYTASFLTYLTVRHRTRAFVAKLLERFDIRIPLLDGVRRML